MTTYKGRKHYSLEFKRQLVKDIFKYKSKVDVCLKYNVSYITVSRWFNQFMSGNMQSSKSGYHNKYNNMTFDWINHIFKLLSYDQNIQYEYIIKELSLKWTQIRKYQYIYNVKQNIDIFVNY